LAATDVTGVKEQAQTVGRRKSSVARVLLRPGGGQITVNGRPLEEYFPVHRHRSAVEEPLRVTETEGLYDVRIRVSGGGMTGQAEAAQLGVARALLEMDEDRRIALRSQGFLTRDAREVERKKPGQPKARKRFQFSKR
jgi:small subunit ribosomal protein S9